MLGVMLPTEESAGHLKRWYEAGGDGLDFEKDLVLPLMTAYKKYREEYANVRGINLGTRSITEGEPPSLLMSHARKNPHQQPVYPDLNINVLPDEEMADGGQDGEYDAVEEPVAYTPSGAPIWGIP